MSHNLDLVLLTGHNDTVFFTGVFTSVQVMHPPTLRTPWS